MIGYAMESGNLLAIVSALRPRATELLHRNELPLCAKSVLTRCSKKALLFDHLSASASGARAAVGQSTIVKNK
jgi:hypothetical protein